MDETRFLSSYFGAPVRLFVTPELSITHEVCRKLFRGRGHHRARHVSVVFLQIQYRDNSGDTGAYVDQFLEEGIVISEVYK